MNDPGYFVTITSEDHESGGMEAGVAFYDSLDDALKATRRTVLDFPEEYHIVSITIVNAQKES